MDVLVPFRAQEPKTRLGAVLDATEREEFARLMLADVLEAVTKAGYEPSVLSTARLAALADEHPVIVDERPLTEAVNAHLDPPTAVVMADLALATPASLSRLFAADGDVVLVPGRGGGTNALVARHRQFRVDYHGASYRDHQTRCESIGADVGRVDSYRLSTDVDEPSDLPEVLLHGRGKATDWLDARFDISVSNGRVDLTRRECS